MQPPPDAVSEFRVVTNNQSAEYGRAAGATVNVAYRSGTNQIHGDAWEFFRDTTLNAERLLQAGRRRQAAARPQPVRRRARRTDRAEQGVLLRRLRRASVRTRRRPRSRRIANAAQRQGILSVDIRDPRTGAVYPAGTPIPMTAFARKVLGGAAGAERRRRREQLLDRAGLHQRLRQGGRQDRPAGEPDAVDVRPLRLAQTSAPTISRRFRCPPAAAATATSTRATSSWCSARRGQPRRHVAARGALRLVEHAGRQESAGARSAALGQLQHPRPARPIRASLAACRRSRSPATPRSAARPPTRSGSTRRCGTRR